MKPFWIKERHNPQLGVYWVACGQLGVREAMKKEDSLYGHNIMHRFNTKSDYCKRIYELKSKGVQVQ